MVANKFLLISLFLNLFMPYQQKTESCRVSHVSQVAYSSNYLQTIWDHLLYRKQQLQRMVEFTCKCIYLHTNTCAMHSCVYTFVSEHTNGCTYVFEYDEHIVIHVTDYNTHFITLYASFLLCVPDICTVSNCLWEISLKKPKMKKTNKKQGISRKQTIA